MRSVFFVDGVSWNYDLQLFGNSVYWLIDINDISTYLGLFYARNQEIKYIVHLYLHFLCSCFLKNNQISNIPLHFFFISL